MPSDSSTARESRSDRWAGRGRNQRFGAVAARATLVAMVRSADAASGVSMYNPAVNRIDDRDAIFDLIELARFGHVVSTSQDGMAATGLPLLLDRQAGVLRGHFARANGHWRVLDGAEVLVIFPLADGYVSPSRYPSKALDGRVVPTWNYEVVHAHGTASVHDDREWLRRLVTDLTDHHESSHSAGAGEPWAVTDAPADFVDRQLGAIVGVEMAITRLDGKRKLSQNRSDDDRRSVIDGHDGSDDPRDRALADAMRATDRWDAPT